MRTSTEVAWAAGLFEGEGSISLNKNDLRLNITSTDADVVHGVKDALQIGRVYGPYGPYGQSKKQVYLWAVTGHEKVQAVIAMLWPWLKSRRQKRIVEVFTLHNPRALEDQKGYRVTHCPRGHEYTLANTYVDSAGGRSCKICVLTPKDPARIVRRTTVCPKGHPYVGDNLYISPKGLRYCRTCNRLAVKEQRERKRSEQPR